VWFVRGRRKAGGKKVAPLSIALSGSTPHETNQNTGLRSANALAVGPSTSHTHP